MKTSKEMQLKIIDKMRENIESDQHMYTNIQVKGRGVLSGWLNKEDSYLDFLRFDHRVKPQTITINGVEIPKPLTKDEMKSLDKDGVYFPCSNPAMYSVESKRYCIANRAWENVGYRTEQEAIEASKLLFGIKG